MLTNRIPPTFFGSRTSLNKILVWVPAIGISIPSDIKMGVSKDFLLDMLPNLIVSAPFTKFKAPVIKDGKYYGFISKSRLLTAYRRKLIHATA